VKKLNELISKNNYEIAGAHEDEYITTPKAKVQKTLIRYPIKKIKIAVDTSPANS